MRKMARLFYIYFKELGYIKYITFVIIMILGLFCRLGEAETTIILKSFEMFLLPFSAWWIIQGFYNYVDESAKEIYLSYPLSRFFSGIFKLVCYYIIFFSLIITVFLYINREEVSIIYIIALLSESLLWIGIGFFLVVFTKNIVLSLGIVWGYVAIQVLDIDKYFKNICIYFYDINYFSALISKIIVIDILALFLMLLAQGRFHKMNLE